ncbi:heavy metal translocating P-type ATPase [Neobacillus jeddahensis]|uniref:heavy metal translocating P-type ATPase n=1 Tax=Neobacillus jeddahensis TaxID=1461580 RepID=UPI000590C57F|nr:cation-translocating P-type ATPase [Neobacillus jeddahensis]
MAQRIHQYKNQITAISFVLIAVGFILGFFHHEDGKNLALLIATISASLPIFTKAFQALRMRVFSIELLVSIAVIGAVLLGEYTESSVVTFLFLFGDYLEARTLAKTRKSLKELTDLAPQEAMVIRFETPMTIPVEEVVVGDRVMIRSGGKVPVDGRIVSGQASLNEAAITGEAVPVTKRQGDLVFSGTIVDNGYIEITAERVGDDTTFAKIMELVEEAQESKTPAEKFLHQFAAIYTPVVVLLSMLVLGGTRDIHMAITFLVIACPGALVIGAPVSSVAGIGNGAKHGVLIKGGEIMDTFAKVNAMVFDKTGTLTNGKPEVVDIKTFSSYGEADLLHLVAQAETISEHHLGQTIVKEAEARNFPITNESKQGEVLKGLGICATINGHTIAVGNRKLMEKEQIVILPKVGEYAVHQEKSGSTAVFAAIDGKLSGVISIADQLRQDAPNAIAELRKNGIKKIVMLTGDNRHTAALTAQTLALDEYAAELLPEEKAAFVKQLKESGYVVAMVGDGINDAPAIATADIGLAMGRGGTDVAVETADVVLMADRLEQLAHAYTLSKATIRNIKQNTYFAVVIVLVLLAGVLFGSVHLASGMFIHEASVLLVIVNAMRLIGFQSSKDMVSGDNREEEKRYSR